MFSHVLYITLALHGAYLSLLRTTWRLCASPDPWVVPAVDFVAHVGDVGYADGFCAHWDVFLNKVQPIASTVAYMVNPG